jgi:hypothetical protein
MQGSEQYGGVRLSFSLPASSSREAQFAFKVMDTVRSHKLRATLTYMVEVSSGVIKYKLVF